MKYMKSLWDFRIWGLEAEVLVFGCTGESLGYVRWLSAMCNKVGDDNFVTFGIRLLLRRVIMKDTVITEQWGHKWGNISLNFDVCIVASIPKLSRWLRVDIQLLNPGNFMALPFHHCKSHCFLLVIFGICSELTLVTSRSYSLSWVNSPCMRFLLHVSRHYSLQDFSGSVTYRAGTTKVMSSITPFRVLLHIAIIHWKILKIFSKWLMQWI
jgi:hypothetical protein